ERYCRRLRLSRTVVMAAEDVAYGTAIGNHVTGELPSAAQRVLEKEFVRARRLAVDGVVSAHYRTRVAFDHCRPKRRQVRVFLVMPADVDICEVSRRFGPTVHGKMFWSGDSEVVPGIRT